LTVTEDVCEEGLPPDVIAQEASAMAGSARTSLHVEFIIEGFRMVGRLDLRGAQSRLVDVLNFRDEHVIVLHDVEARRLEPESDKVFNCPVAHIRREAIILAIPHDHRSPSAEAQPPLEYVAKEPHRVSFLMPAFTVVGNLHLAKGVDINVASPIRGLDFVPLTDAEAIYLPDPTIVWRAAVIIVNAAKAEACCPGLDLSSQQLS
jgi:hypothetical protein